jgi:rare lipoprotein A
MKRRSYLLFAFCIAVIIFPDYSMAQSSSSELFRQEGIASWYGREFDGRPTASGEIFNSSLLTAAHLSLPFGTIVVVTNLHNNKKVTVRINDRGPFVASRVIDVSRAAAEELDMIVTGTAPVLIESIDRIFVSPPPVLPPIVLPPPETLPPVTLPPDVVIPPVEIPRDTSPDPLPAFIPLNITVRLIPDINIDVNKLYRLQVGSYRVARNAVEAFDRLKNAGLNPAYERYTDANNIEHFRVVLASIRGSDVRQITEKIGSAGFREAVIRTEN